MDAGELIVRERMSGLEAGEVKGAGNVHQIENISLGGQSIEVQI
jgi:hypothetical protein